MEHSFPIFIPNCPAGEENAHKKYNLLHIASSEKATAIEKRREIRTQMLDISSNIPQVNSIY